MSDDIYERIQEGYIDLCVNGGEKRVSALCDRIDIIMSEFYQCYHDLDDLHSQMQRDIIRDMFKSVEGFMTDGFDICIFIDKSMEFMNAHADRFDFFIDVDKDTKLNELWSSKLVKTLKKATGSDDLLALETLSNAVIGGMIYAYGSDIDDCSSLKKMASALVTML